MKNFVSAMCFALFYAVAIGNAEEYLVRVNNLTDTDFTVIQKIENHSLILATDGDLLTLEQRSIPYRILDTNPKDHLYLLVFPFGEFVETIAQFGSILDYYDDCVLLRTTENNIPHLNNLQVELSRLFFRPVHIKSTTEPALEKYDLRADTLIEKLVNAVSQDSIYASVLRMQRMYTRYATSDSNKLVAVPWIANRLLEYGCDSVYFHNFSGSYGPNVIGIRRGKVDSAWNKYCVIGGHLDDVPSSGYAPGADDNASGTTAMLEAARVMKDFNFEHTIRFIGFNAEEQGLIGSAEYASNAHTQGDTIIGVFNFDMIGYVQSPNRDTVNAHYTTAVPGCSLFVCEFFQAVADTYTQLKIRKVRNTGTSGSSDHASFWQNDYKAMLGIERVLCPGYHTIGDTIGPSGLNNLPFATKVIQTGVAALAKLAIPVSMINALPNIPIIIRPLDFAKLPDLQPTLSFYAVDPNNDSIQYRILWDIDPNFATPESITTNIYANNDIVDFTFLSPLSDGETYWCKIKCTDPEGSGEWSEYTTERSFTVDITLPQNTCSWFQTKGEQFNADSLSGTIIQGDSVVLVSNDSGLIIGLGVNYHNLSTTYPRAFWGDAVWYKATPQDSIGIQVEYYNVSIWQLIPDVLIPNNSIGNFTSLAVDTVSLANVDTVTYNTLRLKALFYSITKSPVNPSLLDWELGNLTNYMAIAGFIPDMIKPSFVISPNPSRNRLNIKYSLGQQVGNIELKIYDATGRLVRQFDNTTIRPSDHIIWEGTDDFSRKVPAGVYFVQFVVNPGGEIKGESYIEKAILFR